jgi:hypothetical protein
MSASGYVQYFSILCNVLFMIGAVFLLYRIVDSVEGSEAKMAQAAQQATQTSEKLLQAAYRSIKEMERASEVQRERELANAQAMRVLSASVGELVEQFKLVLAKAQTPAFAGADAPVAAQETTAHHSGVALEKMRRDLESTQQANLHLKEEISQTGYKLADALQTNRKLMQDLQDAKEIRKDEVAHLVYRSQELEDQLQLARSRGNAAERLAEENAFRIEDLREQLAQNLALPLAATEDLGPAQPDADMLKKLEFLAAREKELLGNISALEDLLKRNLTEKAFIEERFLVLDSLGRLEPAMAGQV